MVTALESSNFLTEEKFDNNDEGLYESLSFNIEPIMSLADYLAKNYLSDSKKKKQKKEKKSKKKQPESASNVIIEDNQPITNVISDIITPEQTEISPALTIESKRTPSSKGWKVVGTDEVVTDFAETQQEVENEQRMSSGAKAGLQTGEEVARQMKEKQEAELEYLRANPDLSLGKDAETVYRDATGKRVDMAQRRAEARERQILEEEKSRLEHKKRNMGLVQLLDLQENRKNLEKAGTQGLARYADDEELNAKLKNKDHEDDPLLSFNPGKSKKYVSRTGRKLYKGGYPENRFGIAPGWRWDGVDRSNGFEKSWFKKHAEIAEKKTLSYTMQEDY